MLKKLYRSQRSVQQHALLLPVGCQEGHDEFQKPAFASGRVSGGLRPSRGCVVKRPQSRDALSPGQSAVSLTNPALHTLLLQELKRSKAHATG